MRLRNNSGYARSTVLIAAAAAGLATIALLYLSLFAPWKQPSKTVSVVVAAEDISADTVISPGMLRIETVPESQMLPGAATRTTDVIQKVTTIPVRIGEQLVTTMIVDKATAFGLAGIIPPGTRAMTIAVDSADAVSGFLQPGDHVDVLATFAQGADSVARTILQDVVLLAVNANLRPVAREQPAGEARGATQGQTPEATTTRVTIAVTPSEAERLVAAQYKGKLKIGLRGLNDNSRSATSGASLNAIFGIAEQPTGVSAPVQQPMALTQKKASAAVSVKRASRRRAFVSKAPEYTTLPPFIPNLETEPRKIRVIKGNQVQEVEVGR